MSVAIRLQRHGSKKRPFYQVVVADSRSCRDGAFIERIGHYNPVLKETDFAIQKDRLDYWMKNGARPTLTVHKLLKTLSK